MGLIYVIFSWVIVGVITYSLGGSLAAAIILGMIAAFVVGLVILLIILNQ